MTILNGGSGPLSTASGTVSIDLSPIVGNLSSTLSQRTGGAVTLPPGTGKIVLLKSDQLSAAQSGVKLLRLASIPLALLGSGCWRSRSPSAGTAEGRCERWPSACWPQASS